MAKRELRICLVSIRRQPIHFMGYVIACHKGREGKTWHPSVLIEGEVLRELKARFVAMVMKVSVEELREALRRIDYEPYAAVRDQLHGVLRVLNRHRGRAGLEPVPWNALRFLRVPVRPFD